jgi:Cytochrome P460
LSYTPEAATAASAPPPRAPRQQFHSVSEPSDVLASGVFSGRRVGLEVAVKNSFRADGKTTSWAYYNFTDPSDPAKVLASATAFPDQSCANCHQLHASIDNVWVQFHPTLRDARR